MKMSLEDHLTRCIQAIEKTPDRNMLSGIGDLMDSKMKDFVRNRLKAEALSFLEAYRRFPITE